MAMGWSTRATDWKVAGAAQVGGAAAVGGGIWCFVFQSETAQWSGMFAFGAVGLGEGGSIGGASLPDFSSGGLNWSQLECDRAFSAADLNWSPGRLSTAGAGLAVGYGVVILTAFNLSGSMFSSQNCWGGTVGVGASIMTTVGMWKWMSTGAMQR
jgi:hypothetical protein